MESYLKDFSASFLLSRKRGTKIPMLRRRISIPFVRRYDYIMVVIERLGLL